MPNRLAYANLFGIIENVQTTVFVQSKEEAMRQVVKLQIEFLPNLMPCRCWCYGCPWRGPIRSATKEGRAAITRDFQQHVEDGCIPEHEWRIPEEAAWTR
jgi:hypothetical protein